MAYKSKEVQELADAIARMETRLRDDVHNSVKIAVLEQIQKCSDGLDDRINKRLQISLLLATGVLTVFGAIGYLLIQRTVPRIVQDSLSGAATTELERIKRDATSALSDIKSLQSAARGHSAHIVLQTDYGTKGPYMGTLMGVIHRINPHAHIHTITAEINDFDAFDAAWTLWRASRFYPAGTIFVAITNPGGLTSRPVVIVTKNGHTYIGHDNGCFDFVVDAYGHKDTYRITSSKLTPVDFSELFGGVEIFGPTAAHLSMGFPLDEIGPKIESYDYKLPKVYRNVSGSVISGTVVNVDKFGNVTTNITKSDVAKSGLKVGSFAEVTSGRAKVSVPLHNTYGRVSKRSPLLVFYEELLQFSINEGNCARSFGIVRGSSITVKAL